MDTKELLILKATELFAKNGYDGTTVKDIADAAGINVSLVSYHFGGKEALFHECLNKFGEEQLGVAYKILQVPKSQQEFKVRFEVFIDELTKSYVEKADLMALVHSEFESGRVNVTDSSKVVFFKAFSMVVDFFESSQKQGFIRKDIDAAPIAFFILAAVKNAFVRPHSIKPFLKFSVEAEEGRKRFKENMVKIFLEGIYKEKR